MEEKSKTRREVDVIERRIDKKFIESQKKIIIGRINKYLDPKRISEELQADDVSPYIMYKQKQVVPQLEKALRIIHEGKYGVCLACGGNIEIERLIAVPAAFVCVACLRVGKTG